MSDVAYLGDDTVETRALVAETVLAGGELAEVLRRLGHDVVVQLERDAALGRAVDRNIKLRVLIVSNAHIIAPDDDEQR